MLHKYHYHTIITNQTLGNEICDLGHFVNHEKLANKMHVRAYILNNETKQEEKTGTLNVSDMRNAGSHL